MSFRPAVQDWRDPTREEIEAAASLILGNDVGELPHPGPIETARDPASWRWSPVDADLAAPRLLFLHEYWRRLRGDRTAPHAREVDPVEMKPVLGFVLLSDVLDEGFDARYRLYGSGVSEKAGRDWTGASISEMSRIIRTDMALFFRATYLAVYRRREPLFTSHDSPPWLPAACWERIILPLTDDAGNINRFMVGIGPVGSRYLDLNERKEQRARVSGSEFGKD